MRDRAAHAQITLRPMERADTPFLRTLGERAFAPYSTYPGESLLAMLDERGTAVAVAEAGRARLGFALVEFEALPRDFGPWKRPVLARLNAIAVRPTSQRRGVGRSLLAWAEDVGRVQGAVSLSLMTAETNTAARQLFESSGFLSVGRLGDVYIHGQAGIAMFKPLL